MKQSSNRGRIRYETCVARARLALAGRPELQRFSETALFELGRAREPRRIVAIAIAASRRITPESTAREAVAAIRSYSTIWRDDYGDVRKIADGILGVLNPTLEQMRPTVATFATVSEALEQVSFAVRRRRRELLGR